MINDNKCPCCGGTMKFQPSSQKLVCNYCDSEFTNEEYQEAMRIQNEYLPDDEFEEVKKGMKPLDEAVQLEGEAQEYNNTNENVISDAQADEMVQFFCNSCGAVLITDKNTASTICNYCDSPMIIGERLSGTLAPDFVIPFKFDKKQANDKFNEWKKKGLFLPKSFKEATKVKELKCQYVPFWFFDMDSKGNMNAIGTKTRHYTRGNYNYTETSYYQVNRKFDLDFQNLPVDASIKMDDKTMDMLEPFNAAEFVPYSNTYLTGYLAEKYDYTDKDLFKRVYDRAYKYTFDYVKSTCGGYDSLSVKSSKVNILPTTTKYALLPVWFFNYKYNGEDYSFTMNGQTGKVVGTPPIVKGKVAGFFSGTTIVVLILLRILMHLIGGAPLL